MQSIEQIQHGKYLVAYVLKIILVAAVRSKAVVLMFIEPVKQKKNQRKIAIIFQYISFNLTETVLLSTHNIRFD